MAITDVKSGLPTPYATLAESNILLESTEPWYESDDETKQEALGWARVYLDSNYSHSFEEDDVPVVVKHANAILANEHLTTSLFSRQTASDPLEEIEVKAGSVSTRKRYSARSTWFDPFPHVTQLIKEYSSLSPRSSDSPVVRA